MPYENLLDMKSSFELICCWLIKTLRITTDSILAMCLCGDIPVTISASTNFTSYFNSWLKIHCRTHSNVLTSKTCFRLMLRRSKKKWLPQPLPVKKGPCLSEAFFLLVPPLRTCLQLHLPETRTSHPIIKKGSLVFNLFSSKCTLVILYKNNPKLLSLNHLVGRS